MYLTYPQPIFSKECPRVSLRCSDMSWYPWPQAKGYAQVQGPQRQEDKSNEIQGWKAK
jgi:hypothetical protein